MIILFLFIEVQTHSAVHLCIHSVWTAKCKGPVTAGETHGNGVVLPWSFSSWPLEALHGLSKHFTVSRQRRPCTHSVLPKNTSTCRLYWAVIEPQTFRSIDEHTPFGPQSEIRLNIFLPALKGDSHTYSMSRPFSESFPFFTSTSVASFNINGMYCKHLKMFTVHASSANMKLEFIA